MIRRDVSGFVVDVQNGDGGDSANRAGLLALCGTPEDLCRYEHVWNARLSALSGVLMRHPLQEPWNNPWNFSRDQLIPFVAGCWAIATDYPSGQHAQLARHVFWAHARRFFFCQNFERDWPGTTKYPWPEYRISEDGKGMEWKLFDFADPLLPNDIAHLIKCARLRWLYWLLPVGWLFLILTTLAHRWDKSCDDGQIVSECVVAGRWAVKLYTWAVKDWEARLDRYWGGWRQCPEMAEMLKKLVKSGQQPGMSSVICHTINGSL